MYKVVIRLNKDLKAGLYPKKEAAKWQPLFPFYPLGLTTDYQPVTSASAFPISASERTVLTPALPAQQISQQRYLYHWQ